MAPITPPERSGEGRTTIGDRHALIRASPHSPGLLAPQAIVVERLPDESTPEEFLNNERRRVGRIHDLAEQLAADPAASNCPKVTIYGHAATDALELARQRRRRSGVAMRRASEISRFWSIEVSANGFSKAGGDAGLRLADLRSEDSASFQILDKVGRTPGSAAWEDLDRRRSRDCLVGVLVTNEVDGGTVVLLNHHALSQLYEEGLVLITADETVHDAWELPGKATIRDRIQQSRQVVRGTIAEIEVTSDLIIKIVAAGGAIGVILRFLGVL
jgi:hypothetical protein